MDKKLMKIACPITISGLAMIIVSFGLFGSAIWRGLDANEVLSAPLEPNKVNSTELIEVDTHKNCMISVIIDFKSNSVQEEEEKFGKPDEVKYKLKYRFPVSYKVLNADESIIHAEKRNVGWNEMNIATSPHSTEVDSRGGTAVIEHYFAKFKVSPPGLIRVEVEVGPDSHYRAEAKSLELKIYDNVSKHAKSVLGGCFLCCVGPLVLIVGVILCIIGLVRSGK